VDDGLGVEKLHTWRKELAGRRPEEILRWAEETFRGRVAFATSLGLEDQILTHMIAGLGCSIPLFTLDTGRLFPETYELMERTSLRYGIPIKVCFPNAEEVCGLVNEHGINLFRKSVALRKECCRIRKVNPLRRELARLDAWIVGLRREQAATRRGTDEVEWDESGGLYRISPLVRWTLEEVWTYVRENDVPYHPFHDRGFPSIGCAPCTRAVDPGEDIRSGRWWWESGEHRECGLHDRSQRRTTGGK